MSEPPGNNKKERVLHTRISETLDRELRSKAEELGVSVSKLVRNALSNTMDLVENIVADSARVAGSARDIGATLNGEEVGVPTSAAATPSNEVVGWQEAVLNMNAVCAECNSILTRGSRGALGFSQAGRSPLVLCLQCLEKLTSEVVEDTSANES